MHLQTAHSSLQVAGWDHIELISDRQSSGNQCASDDGTEALDGENTIDWEMAGATVVSAILPILLLLPVVRKSYWQAAEIA